MKQMLILIAFAMTGGVSAQKLESPSGKLSMQFSVTAGKPVYSLSLEGKPVILESALGLMLEGHNLSSGFEVASHGKNTIDETWKPVLGEVEKIRNRCNELKVSLVQPATKLKMDVVFRLFDEGLAFRYEIPQQQGINYFQVTDEITSFNLTGNHKTFWIPGDFDSQEYVYNETTFSAIDNSKLDLNNGIAFKSIAGRYAVQSPLMMKTVDNIYLNIFEAAVVNYPVMHLTADVSSNTLTATLAPSAAGAKAYLQAPFKSPWRTVMATRDARDILNSKMILNLNEPSKIADVSWIKPMKYIGIWWEMHVGIATWDYAGSQNAQNAADRLIPTGKHGATTQNTKRYIDFAARHGFDGVLVEGWNVGWEDWFGNWKEDVFDFVTPYPDFDLKEVTDYAKSKGVKMIMHHETSGSVSNYERRLDRAFNLMKQYGYPAVKTGYVGRIVPRGEFHDGQVMVNHFNYVAERAAEYQIMVNSHESTRPTGVHRTWPNYIAAEAARGNEFNAWSSGNPPDHETILPFTRLLGGPMDYTPGIFEIKMSTYDPAKKDQVHTTLAKQLALYVTLYSPLQMAADLPQNYEKHLDAFQFIKDVALDWQDTRILEAEPGDYVTIARKAKYSENWFLGAITDENPRKTALLLDFLTPGKKYKATIYEDAPGAHYRDNPKAYRIRTVTVTAKNKLNFNLAAGGGAAVSLSPL